jgi:hypothetical protein
MFCKENSRSRCHITRVARFSAKTGIQVPYQVQAEIAGRIGNAFICSPDIFFVTVSFNFRLYFIKVPGEEALKSFDEHHLVI